MGPSCWSRGIQVLQQRARLRSGPQRGHARQASLLLGVVEEFLELARAVTGMQNPNFHEICPTVARGSKGMGFGKSPREMGEKDAASLPLKRRTFRVMVLGVFCERLRKRIAVVDSQRRRGCGRSVLWVCFFCNNQRLGQVSQMHIPVSVVIWHVGRVCWKDHRPNFQLMKSLSRPGCCSQS